MTNMNPTKQTGGEPNEIIIRLQAEAYELTWNLSKLTSKKGNLVSKHAFEAINLVLCCKFSASILKFQLFLNYLLKKRGRGKNIVLPLLDWVQMYTRDCPALDFILTFHNWTSSLNTWNRLKKCHKAYFTTRKLYKRWN